MLMQSVHGEQKLHATDYRSLGNVLPLPPENSRLATLQSTLDRLVMYSLPAKSGWIKIEDDCLAMDSPPPRKNQDGSKLEMIAQ